MRRAGLLLTTVSAAALLAGCQQGPAPAAAQPSPVSTPTASAVPSPTRSPTPSPTPAPRKAPVARATATRPPAPVPRRSVARVAVPAVPPCPRVPDVGRATQVVLVVGSGSRATVRACERRAGRWVSVLGSMAGHVGRNGVAPPGAKREGDGRTPSGTYGLGLGFGNLADPGVAFRWRRVGSRDVWVDDPGSRLYNTWQQEPADGRWGSAEPLDVPAYDYAQVIDYNTARVPGAGSAIFLHVDRGRGTAGCVSVPRAALLRVLRWERPGAVAVVR